MSTIDYRHPLYGGAVDTGSYTLPATCSNCGWAGDVRLRKGQRRPSIIKPKCPTCGCTTVDVLAKTRWPT